MKCNTGQNGLTYFRSMLPLGKPWKYPKTKSVLKLFMVYKNGTLVWNGFNRSSARPYKVLIKKKKKCYESLSLIYFQQIFFFCFFWESQVDSRDYNQNMHLKIRQTFQPAFTCSESTMETPGHYVKFVQIKKDTRMMSVTYFWCLSYWSGVFIVDFDQVNAGWFSSRYLLVQSSERNTAKRCEICLKLRSLTSLTSFWCLYC